MILDDQVERLEAAVFVLLDLLREHIQEPMTECDHKLFASIIQLMVNLNMGGGLDERITEAKETLKNGGNRIY